MSAALWIPLDGAANARDVGGLPSAAGPVQAGRLIRADNLQTLSAADVHELVDVRGVTDVADLRSRIEVDADGAGPLERDGRVRIHHLSLHTEVGRATDVADDTDINATDTDAVPDLVPDYVERSRPRAETIGELLTRVDEEFGGTAAWLAAQGWTSADDAALHDKLLAADSERARPVGRALSD